MNLKSVLSSKDLEQLKSVYSTYLFDSGTLISHPRWESYRNRLIQRQDAVIKIVDSAEGYTSGRYCEFMQDLCKYAPNSDCGQDIFVQSFAHLVTWTYRKFGQFFEDRGYSTRGPLSGIRYIIHEDTENLISEAYPVSDWAQDDVIEYFVNPWIEQLAQVPVEIFSQDNFSWLTYSLLFENSVSCFDKIGLNSFDAEGRLTYSIFGSRAAQVRASTIPVSVLSPYAIFQVMGSICMGHDPELAELKYSSRIRAPGDAVECSDIGTLIANMYPSDGSYQVFSAGTCFAIQCIEGWDYSLVQAYRTALTNIYEGFKFESFGSVDESLVLVVYTQSTDPDYLRVFCQILSRYVLYDIFLEGPRYERTISVFGVSSCITVQDDVIRTLVPEGKAYTEESKDCMDRFIDMLTFAAGTYSVFGRAVWVNRADPRFSTYIETLISQEIFSSTQISICDVQNSERGPVIKVDLKGKVFDMRFCGRQDGNPVFSPVNTETQNLSDTATYWPELGLAGIGEWLPLKCDVSGTMDAFSIKFSNCTLKFEFDPEVTYRVTVEDPVQSDGHTGLFSEGGSYEL